MSRSQTLLVLCSLAVASELLAPRPAAAGVFHQSWATSAWWVGNGIGNTDADAQMEMLFLHKSDSHYGIFDQMTGVVEKEFPDFTTNNSTYSVGDIDGDDRLEIFFWSHPNIVPAFFRAYAWTGSDYVPFIAHSDPVFSLSWEKFRTAILYDLWEMSDEPGEPTCDFRLRDQSGSVFFRASTDVPGWSPPLTQVSWVDRNQDGVQELILEDQNKVHGFNQYSGSFTVAWALTGWSQAVELGNVDGDVQSELLVKSNADGRYAVVDVLTGAVQQEFPALQYPNAFIHGQDITGDGRLELIARKITGGSSELSIYEWNGVGFAPSVTVTGADPYSNLTLVQLRGAAQYEIWDLAPADVLLRDLSGGLLFRASTDVPGWSVAPFTLTVDLADPDHDGVSDMVLYDESHVWDIRYTGTFGQAWVADGWRFVQDLGNVDADPQSEFMLSSGADGRFAIFDGVTGASQQEFASFSLTTSTYFKLDTTADGHPELYFGRNPGQTPLFTAYSWNGSTYAPASSHAEPMGQWSPVQARSASQFEFLELDNTDIRVRDLDGTVLFRASTHLPGWAGLPNSFAAPLPDVVGPRALMVGDEAQVRVVLYYDTSDSGPEGTTAFRVFPAAPNPFRTSTAFRIASPKAGKVGIRIYDARGRLVRKLDQELAAGLHEIGWDGRDDRGRSVGSGVLFYEIRVDGSRRAGKLIRMQ